MDKFMVQFGEKDIGKLLDLFQGSAEKIGSCRSRQVALI
jgi:hypothetical protein